MDDLVKEFFRIQTGFKLDTELNYDSLFEEEYPIDFQKAKAAASLCREKCKEAINLARCFPVYTSSNTNPSFTIQQIYEKLKL